MTVAEAVQTLMGCGMLGHVFVMFKWVLKVETRLVVLETKQG